MKAWVKRRWINALRSGNYEQGRGNLAFVDEGVTAYCCLGVLCELSPVIPKRDDFEGSSLLRFDGSSLTLPPKVQLWAGLNTDDPRVAVDGEEQSLSACNDDLHLSLSMIAALIESGIPVEPERHRCPIPCRTCSGTERCTTINGNRPTKAHAAALAFDNIWSAAHTALDLGNINVAVANLVVLNRIYEGVPA